MMCALPANQTLALRSVLNAEDLAGQRMIGPEPASRIGAAVAAAFHARGSPYSPAITVLQGVTACSLVARGLGVAVTDEFSAAAWTDRGVVLRPFEPAMVVVASAMNLVERPLSRLARRFVQLARRTAQTDRALAC